MSDAQRPADRPRPAEARVPGGGRGPRGEGPRGPGARSSGDRPRGERDRGAAPRGAERREGGGARGPRDGGAQAARGLDKRNDGARRDAGARNERRDAEAARPRDVERARGTETGRAALGEIRRRRRLDLDAPPEQPLSAEETRELEQHLGFLRRHKALLRLPLNAQEDLYVNGARPIPDRGAARHLIGKLDRPTIDRALARNELRTREERARFLGGCARIVGDPELLVLHLEAVAEAADRAEAAELFHLTIERVDFGALGERATAALLSTALRAFPEQARPRVLFGLLENESFHARLAAVLANAEPPIAAAFAPLERAFVVLTQGGEEPEDEAGHALLLDGARALLSSGLARTLPVEARARLTELALAARLGVDPPEPRLRDAVRRVAEGLPRELPSARRLRRASIDARLAEGFVDEARAMLNQERDQPAAWLESRRAMLAWARVGELSVAREPERSGLRRAFSWTRAAPVWARIGRPEDAAAMKLAALLHTDLAGLAVVPLLEHGLTADGTPFAVYAPFGLGGAGGGLGAWSRRDRLGAALAVAELAAGLAQRGIALPDLAPERFVVARVGALRLADLSGATRDDPARAPIALGGAARALVLHVLGDDRGMPAPLRRRLTRELPLALLVSALAEAHATSAADELEREPKAAAVEHDAKSPAPKAAVGPRPAAD
jgi:hypothetical protein